MIYSENEILQYIEENDVKFVKLTFCDINGKMKNISILSSELSATFEHGARITAKKIKGFEIAQGRDLFLFPDAVTMTLLPWRPQQGRVIRMFCYIRYADGTPFEGDGRYFLKKAMKEAIAKGFRFRFGTSCEFMLFRTSDSGKPLKKPHDYAGYCDIAPDDKGENIRRDVCLTMEQMGIHPVSSRHESGHGQHEIDFNASTALKAAETFLSFKSAVKSVAEIHGVHASFMPKPMKDDCGNGMHISFSIEQDNDMINDSAEDKVPVNNAAAGLLKYIRNFTMLTNSTVNSYKRLGEFSAPRNIIWSTGEGSQLLRIAEENNETAITLRAADCACNPYFVFGLIIYSALEGIEQQLELPAENSGSDMLPSELSEAIEAAEESQFLRKYIPENILAEVIAERKDEWKEYTSAYDKETFEEKKYFYNL